MAHDKPLRLKCYEDSVVRGVRDQQRALSSTRAQDIPPAQHAQLRFQLRSVLDPAPVASVDILGHTSDLMVRHFVAWQGAGGQYVRAVALLTSLAEVNDN